MLFKRAFDPCLGLALWFVATSAVAQQVPGDLNANGKVDPADVVLLHRHVTGAALLDSGQQAAADVAPLMNGLPAPDGHLNMADVLVLMRAASGALALNVSGTIDSAVTWGPGTIIYVDGDLTVEGGGSLTVEQGAELRFAIGSLLKVNSGGSLTVQGVESDPVTFTGANGRGSWDGIWIDSASATFSHAVILYADRGVHVTGSSAFAAIAGGRIESFATSGVSTLSGANVSIDGTRIDNTGGSRAGIGVNLSASNASSVFNAPLIGGTLTGIRLANSDATIEGNRIENNDRGIEILARSDPTIRNGNIVTLNTDGIWIQNSLGSPNPTQDPQPTINANKVFANTTWNLRVVGFGDTDRNIDAVDNWWGSEDPIAIKNTIFDASSATSNDKAPWAEFIPFSDAEGMASMPTGTYLWKHVEPGTTILQGPGPHAIVGRVTVPPTAALRIESETAPSTYVPVAVHVGNSSALVVDGRLEIAGEPGTLPGQGAKVTITSAEPTPGPGDWEGILLTPTSSGSFIDQAVIRHAKRPIDVDGSDLSVTNSTVSLFSGLFALEEGGIRYRNGATGRISDNIIDGSLTEGTVTAGDDYGVVLLSASVEISGNDAIRNNRIGVLFRGQGTLPLPSAFTGNNLYDNTDYNLWLDDIANPVAGVFVTLDASSNYWGDADPEGAVATIRQFGVDVPQGSANVSIDFSDLLAAIDGTPVSGTFVKEVFKSVTRSADTLNPALGEQVAIEFELAAPATVTLTTCLEIEDDCDPIAYQEVGSYGKGQHSITWDGKANNDAFLPAQAYSYVLEAVGGAAGDGVNDGTYDPVREFQTASSGEIVLLNLDPQTGLAPVDGYSNLAAVWDVDLDSPARLSLRVLGEFVVPSTPHPRGSSQIRWNGRDSQGVPMEGPLRAYVWDDGKTRPNTILLEGAPTIRGAPPAIEVRASPHLLYRSYGHEEAEFVYRLDQDASVAIHLIPPGATDPMDWVLLASGPRSSGTDYTVPIDPVVVANEGEGTYGIHIEATGAVSGLSGTHLSAIRMRR